MKIIKSTICLACLAVMLTACGEKTQTVEWYIAHPEELKKEVEKCKAKPIEAMMKDKHCQVVENARQKVWREQQKNAQPIKLKF